MCKHQNYVKFILDIMQSLFEHYSYGFRLSNRITDSYIPSLFHEIIWYLWF